MVIVLAATYNLIASNTLGSSAASVTFSSIPQTYTDLVLRCSARLTESNYNLKVTFNSATSNFSQRELYAIGSSAASYGASGQGEITFTAGNPSDATANTFSSGEVYVPNYIGGANKTFSATGVTESNSATNNAIDTVAALWSNTSAITSITFTANSGSLVAGSSFFLYGLKSS